ncbi:MAG: hypothetical protein K2X01_04080 [Cyanobacteria bacterium]|nr:hypothetical protein [Cyanobacteriota bacterium]
MMLPPNRTYWPPSQQQQPYWPYPAQASMPLPMPVSSPNPYPAYASSASGFSPSGYFPLLPEPVKQPVPAEKNPKWLEDLMAEAAKAAAEEESKSAQMAQKLPNIPPSGHVPFSDAVQWIRNGQIARVEIVRDNHSLTAMAHAKMTMKDGRTAKSHVPPMFIPSLARALDEQRIAYEFESEKSTLKKRVKAMLGDMVKESFIPLIVFGVTALGSLLLFRKVVRPMMEKAPLENALKRAVQRFEDVKLTTRDVLKYYEPDVIKKAEAFLRGDLDFFIAQGPPGTGKTYLNNVLAKDTLAGGRTIALDPGFDQQVRDVLRRVYAGDDVDSHHALNILKKLNHGNPIDQILVVTDELEKVPGMNELIVKAIGNASGKRTLPRLRGIATSNQLPVLDDAAKSRVLRGICIIDHPTPSKMTAVIVDTLENALPHFKPEAARGKIERIIQANPGYSTRTIRNVLDAVVKDVEAAVASAPSKGPKPDIVGMFKERLENTMLDDSEVNSLILRRITDRLRGEKRQWNAPNGVGVARLSRQMMNRTDELTRNLGLELSMNGRQVQQVIDRVLDRVVQQKGAIPLVESELFSTIKDIAHTLRSDMGIYGDSALARHAQKLAQDFGAFLFKDVEGYVTHARGLTTGEPSVAIRQAVEAIVKTYQPTVETLLESEQQALFRAAVGATDISMLPAPQQELAKALQALAKNLYEGAVK